MHKREFRKILSATRCLSVEQRASLMRTLRAFDSDGETLGGRPHACPHCEHQRVVGWGSARGSKRWRCKRCERTFTPTTGTVAARLRYREAWPEFAAALIDGETLDGISERCGIDRSTAHRWRTRFLSGLAATQQSLVGIVEIDETYRLRSFKGQPGRRLEAAREARKRGGKAARRGLSRDQVPIVMARDRAGNTHFAVPDVFDGKAAIEILGKVISRDAVLCSDGHRAYAVAAGELGVRHESLVHQRGQRVRGPFHIQNVNGMHSQFKKWIRRFNGVSTSRLPLFVAWFGRVDRASEEQRSPTHTLRLLLASPPR
jgi:transposase-like protein